MLKRLTMHLTIEDLPITICRFPEIKNIRQIYTVTSKGQRNNNKRLMNRPVHPIHFDGTAQRILSARNHKINDQGNALRHLAQQIEELRNENKTLKTQSVRQEKALNKIEMKEADLPKILHQHETEVHSLKELLRRSKDMLNAEIKLRKDGDNEILKLRYNLGRANELISGKNLDERSTLQSQITDLHEKLEVKANYLETSTRYMENLDKSRKREIHSLKKEIKMCSVHCQDLENELKLVKTNLKEKEKLLGIQNIYSHRFKMINRLSESSGPHSEQLLDKLDFKDNNSCKRDQIDKAMEHSSKLSDRQNNNMIDTEKIKENIRKILEEEILSGRLKPFEIRDKQSEICLDNVSNKSFDKQSNDGRSTVQDSYNTDRAIESEIFDKDVNTHVQSLVELSAEPEIDQETLALELKQRQLLLNKLRELDSKKTSDKVEDMPTIPYLNPNDNDFLVTDESISEIETIPASTFLQKQINFSSSVTNLHSGIPVEQSRSDSSVKDTVETNRLPRPSISEVTNNSKRSQIEASHSQKNNSNIEESLPPLNEAVKKRREGELLSELFGDNFIAQPVVHGRPYPMGPRQSRSGNLLWDNELQSTAKNDSKDTKLSLELNNSEDIEQIVL